MHNSIDPNEIQRAREQLRAKAAEARKLNEDHPGDAWTPALQARFKQLQEECAELSNDIKRMEDLSMKYKILKNAPAPDGSLPPGRVGGFAPSGGPFRNLGEQLQAVVNAAKPGGRPDPRLYEVMDSYAGAGEGLGSDGGYLVQSDFTDTLLRSMYAESVLADRCLHIPIGPNANRLEAPIVDETSRATGSRWGGLNTYWLSEGSEITGSKPKFGKLQLDLAKLCGLCHVTEELLADSTAFGAILTQGFSEELAFRLDDAIYRGTGAGQPLGILNSPALVQVAKETGQDADTILWENVRKMWTRIPGRNRPNAVWLINQEAEEQLYSMVQVVGTGGVPVYMPAGGASDAPYASLFGRPVLPLEQASALGDVGDIVLADLSEYLVIDKGGVQAASTIAVRFEYDERSFRFVLRSNGMPLWRAPLTPFKGSNTLSPFVALAAR
jgi:HK97 family phage major capsid protein